MADINKRSYESSGKKEKIALFYLPGIYLGEKNFSLRKKMNRAPAKTFQGQGETLRRGGLGEKTGRRQQQGPSLSCTGIRKKRNRVLENYDRG